MPKTLSKSQFKPRALAFLREVEETGEALILTNRGRPVLRIEPYAPAEEGLAALRGCVIRYDDGWLGVSAISVWEAAMLVKEGRLELALGIDELVRRCKALPGFRFLAITPHIALKSVALEPLHADPADRLIAATALAHRAALVTKDTRLRALDGLVSLW